MTSGPDARLQRTSVVLAVSDATGETAEHAARAALAQFRLPETMHLHAVGHVRTEVGLQEVVAAARERRGMIVYTLAQPELRSRMAEIAHEMDVPAVDLLGALIRELSRFLGAQPLAQPGLGHETDEAYFRRIEAVEYTVQHDDGRGLSTIGGADIVIVGISRTSKTPLSNYIAHRGYKVANVPLVKEVPPPAELESVDGRRIFALTMEPSSLVAVRRARMAALGLPLDGDYGALEHIREEMRLARQIYREHPAWNVVDTTDRAIEETAAEILERWRPYFEPLAAVRPVDADAGARKRRTRRR